MQGYDLQKIQELLEDFYYLTKIKICIYDASGNELCYFPEKFTSFCALIREDPITLERCQSCDRLAIAECKRTGKQYLYTCHAGLLECISPIICDKRIIGYVVIGQIKAEKDADFNKIAHRLPEKFLERLAEYFKELPSIDQKKISSAMRIIDACTGYEYLKGLVRSANDRIDARLERYVTEHLAEDLSVSTLCSHFRLTHRELYSIFKEYLGATPAEYVKFKRLAAASELLISSELPISAIALKCGIPDYNYFSKIFKREIGACPRRYRREKSRISKNKSNELQS